MLVVVVGNVVLVVVVGNVVLVEVLVEVLVVVVPEHDIQSINANGALTVANAGAIADDATLQHATPLNTPG